MSGKKYRLALHLVEVDTETVPTDPDRLALDTDPDLDQSK
jgi:hypothetical protein